MKTIATILALAIAILPSATLAQRAGPGARAGRSAPVSHGTSGGGRGFNLGNDVPSTRQTGGHNGNNNYNRNNNNNYNRNNNNNYNHNYNNNYNHNTNNNYNRNYNNNYNRNVNYNNVNVNHYSYNRTGYNGYGWHGAVVVNPVYRGPAWGWNHGVAWAPNYGYWGGGFWGGFAVGAATAAVMGSIYYNNTHYPSYQVSAGSPGAQLLSNYGLQQVPCGPPGLVVIYGPNNGIICANPNNLVAAGSYAVNENNLTLQSQ
jgi:hypothetical protein